MYWKGEMKLFFEESFERDLRKMKEKSILKKVKEKLEEIKGVNNCQQIKNLKKLRGYKTFYRIRIGNYRIGLEIVENNLIFTRFLHRKEIYKYFP